MRFLRLSVFCTIIIIAGVGFSVYEFDRVSGINHDLIQHEAVALAASIPVDDVAALSGTADDIVKPQYQDLKKELTALRNQNSGLRFAYLVGKNPIGDMFFYADSEDPNSPDYSPPGQLYPEATPEMRSIIESGGSGYDISADRWGSWLSGYAPIVSGTTTIALFGIDRSVEKTYLQQFGYALLPLIAAILCVLLLVGFRVFMPWEK